MSSLEDALSGWRPRANTPGAGILRSAGVPASEEFRRIRDLPRRSHPADLRDLLTQVYKTPNGQQTLRLRQAYTLTELFDFDGCVGILPVGDGKTLASLLAPKVLESKINGPGRTGNSVLLVPANLRDKTLDHDIPFYGQHWRLPQKLEVISYEKLQTAQNANILEELQPELIVCDEAHFLRNRKAARTRRFERYVRARQEAGRPVWLFLMSGTFTKRSIVDYWHLMVLSMRGLCPLPFNYNRMREWADALDADVPEDRRRQPGALLEFCQGDENVRQGFRRRLVETPGIIASAESAFGDEAEPSLELHEVDPGTPPVEIEQAFADLRQSWQTPDGEEITDAVSKWRHAGSLAQGFFLRWVWPDGVADVEWLEARAAWKRFVREILTHNRRGLDSELQVFNAVERGDYAQTEWREWVSVRDRYGPTGPPTEAVWISNWFVLKVAEFMQGKREPWIVWVRNPAMGERLSAALNVPFYGAGNDGIITARSTCIASIQSHGTGKNLQAFAHNLFVVPPLGGSQWQQVMGRTHRPGQTEDAVKFYGYFHCLEFVKALYKSEADARYIQDTTGEPQKLTRSTKNICHTLTDAVNNPSALWRDF